MLITIQIVLIVVLLVSLGSIENRKVDKTQIQPYTLISLACIVGLIITII